jgi:hypothetical protein
MNILNEHGFLSLFKSRKKPNLTPDISFPTQEQLHFTPQLRQFAEDRISGKTAGFGEDYLSRTTNPVIASREARYNEQEIPQLSSQLSARGLARSAGPNLASDVLTRAGQQKERDINEVLAQFYQLNEAQKKQDITQGVGVGEYLQSQQAGMKADQAAASERLSQRTAAQQNQYQSEDRAGLDKLGAMLMSAGAGALSPALGLGMGASQSLGFVPGIGQVSTYGSNVPTGFPAQQYSGPIQKILGADRGGMEAFLRALMGGA